MSPSGTAGTQLHNSEAATEALLQEPWEEIIVIPSPLPQCQG